MNQIVNIAIGTSRDLAGQSMEEASRLWEFWYELVGHRSS